MKDVTYYGNKELLKLHKTAFFASRTIPVDKVLKCYDWAAGKHAINECVISGFSSKLEKDVLHFLMKTTCPIILVLARQLYKEIPEEYKSLLAQNRLLIISISNSARQTRETALERNLYVCELADDIIFYRSNGEKLSISVEGVFYVEMLAVLSNIVVSGAE